VRRRQRYLQTASALLGIAVLSELVLYPLAWLMQSIGSTLLEIRLLPVA